MSIIDPLFQLEAVIALALLSALSLKFKVLDRKGTLAAIPVGYVILVLGDLRYFLVLLIFFAVSGAATKIRIRKIGRGFSEKDWIRSWRNVLANGLIPTIIILLAALSPGDETKLMAAGYLGGIGTAFADTLATEIGLLYPHDPRIITSFKRADRGTPGAVSPYGYAGGALALLILCGVAYALNLQDPRLLLSVFISGIIGMNVDSFLGATVQAKYRCSVCGKLTENAVHCGKPAQKISGVKLITTHIVNLISILIGASLTIILFVVMS